MAETDFGKMLGDYREWQANQQLQQWKRNNSGTLNTVVAGSELMDSTLQVVRALSGEVELNSNLSRVVYDGKIYKEQMDVVAKHSSKPREELEKLALAASRNSERASKINRQMDEAFGAIYELVPGPEQLEDIKEVLGQRQAEAKILAETTAKYETGLKLHTELKEVWSIENPTDAQKTRLRQLQRLTGEPDKADLDDRIGQYKEYLSHSQERHDKLSNTIAVIEERKTAEEKKIKDAEAGLTKEQKIKIEGHHQQIKAYRKELLELTQKEITIGQVIDPAKTEDFSKEWATLEVRNMKLSTHTASNALGNTAVRAVAGSAGGDVQADIGIDDPSTRLTLKGGDGAIQVSATPMVFSRRDVDFTKTITGLREDAGLALAPPQAEPGIKWENTQNFANINIAATNGATVDLTKLDKKSHGKSGVLNINASGGARYLLSDEIAAEKFDLRIENSGTQKKPVVISIPATIERGRDFIYTLNEFRLEMKLQGKVEVDLKRSNDGQYAQNLVDVDIELRKDGKDGEETRRIPVVREGKPLFADGDALRDKIEEEKKALMSDKAKDAPAKDALPPAPPPKGRGMD